MRPGLTLLETLAAITLLGLVAAAVSPIAVRLGQGELGVAERLAARRWLLTQGDPGVAGNDLVRPVKGRPGWFLHRRAFLRTSARPPQDPLAAPEHGWIHLQVRLGAERDAELLAERILLSRDDAAATPGTP
jgi:prepilin-type N-terminal cleavage/methylation domain-containing protein